MPPRLLQLDRSVTRWFADNGAHCLRAGIGVVFVWFGALKFFPGLSPAEGLIEKTVSWAVDPIWFIPTLGGWECAIGIGMAFPRYLRVTLLSLFAHMAGTFLPLFICPEEVWTTFPYAWTLEGQYILKNLVLVGAGLTLIGTLRAREVVAQRAPGITPNGAGALPSCTSVANGSMKESWRPRAGPPIPRSQ